MIDERFDQLVLPTALEEDEVDVYHNPTFAVPLIRTRARRISTVHDVVFRRHPELVEPRLRSYLDRATERAARHADHLITVSEFSRREITALYAVEPKRISAIPNGVDVPSSGQSSNESVLLPGGLAPGKYVLYVGRIEAKKNISTLLLAWKEVYRARADRSLKLALVGSGDPREYPLEEKIQENGLGESVQALGYVPEGALENLYRHALVFVYPSLYEGFGFPPLEAMARGVPTIVSDASSLPEVVGQDAVLVDPVGPGALSRALIDLIDRPDKRNDLSARGRKRASEFTWARSALRHREIYASVMRAS
jgi:glycosyltransferase involved in cell wall biosynthesis